MFRIGLITCRPRGPPSSAGFLLAMCPPRPPTTAPLLRSYGTFSLAAGIIFLQLKLYGVSTRLDTLHTAPRSVSWVWNCASERSVCVSLEIRASRGPGRI